jgi:hypothetical protein
MLTHTAALASEKITLLEFVFIGLCYSEAYPKKTGATFHG